MKHKCGRYIINTKSSEFRSLSQNSAHRKRKIMTDVSCVLFSIQKQLTYFIHMSYN